MHYLNLALPRSGLESVRSAMSFLGVQTRTVKPLSHRNWLDRLNELELLQGHPFSSHYKEVIATLQSLTTPVRLFYVYRSLRPWLESCEKHYSDISTDPWECDKRQRFFGTLLFDPVLFQKAWENRLLLANSLPGCRVINLEWTDRIKWNILQTVVGDIVPFPYENKTIHLKPPPYASHELVA